MIHSGTFKGEFILQQGMGDSDLKLHSPEDAQRKGQDDATDFTSYPVTR
jgi:hypothetical protein